MKKLSYIFGLIISLFSSYTVTAQLTEKKITDTVPLQKITDTASIKKANSFDPKKATIRSAIIPGWGQIYNKKYWKLPLVYGSLGITAGIYFYNIKTYKILKQAYIYKADKDTANDVLIDSRFRQYSAAGIRSLRNTFRQNVDYSVLFFILFWGLNVVDATVDAHLKLFDVNEDLSLHLKPGRSSIANTTGISLVLDIGKRNSASKSLP